MTTGALDRRLLIERKVVTKDPDFGSETIAWVEYARVWGSAVDVLRPKEENTASGLRLLTRPCAVQRVIVRPLTSGGGLDDR